MKGRILSTLLVLALVLSLGLVTAVPVSAEGENTLQVVPFELDIGEYGGEGDEDCLSRWSTLNSEIAVHLDTGLKEEDGDTATILIDASDVGVSTLGDVTSLSWWVYTVAGYPAHIDITLDTANGDQSMLTAEMAYNNALGKELDEGLTPTPGVWLQTFELTAGDGYGQIGDTTMFWVTRMGAGDDDAPFGTLADWKAGTVANDPGEELPATEINADTPVLKLEIEVDNWVLETEAYVDGITVNGVIYFGSIQDAIDEAGLGDTINVATGTYDEQVEIAQSLTLQGVGDTTVIQPSGPVLTPTTSIPWIGATTKAMSAIVSVETTGGEVTIKDLEIDGSLITSKTTLWVGGLVYLETGGMVEGVTVNGGSTLEDRTAGIFAAAITNSVSLEVTECTVEVYTRAGIYAFGAELTVDYHHNEINGPADAIHAGVPNGMFFLDGANGSATYNVITDLAYTGETYLSTGIGTYNAGDGIVFSHNEISNVQNAFALSNGTVGTVIEYNEVYNCQTGVRMESGATASVIQYNDIHGNHYAIRCDEEMGVSNVAHDNNFVNNAGPYDREGYDYAVCNLHPAVFDASNNWWGHSSGPGDAISPNVDAEPWLLTKGGDPYDNTVALNSGWTIVSPGAELESWIAVDADELMLAYAYAEVNGELVGGFTTDFTLDPLTPMFIKTAEGGGIGFIYTDDSQGIFTTDLETGWNLIGVPETSATTGAILSPLRYGANSEVALATLASQADYNPSEAGSFYLATLSETDWESLNSYTLYPNDGYWTYLNVAKEFGVVVVK